MSRLHTGDNVPLKHWWQCPADTPVTVSHWHFMVLTIFRYSICYRSKFI